MENQECPKFKTGVPLAPGKGTAMVATNSARNSAIKTEPNLVFTKFYVDEAEIDKNWTRLFGKIGQSIRGR